MIIYATKYYDELWWDFDFANCDSCKDGPFCGMMVEGKLAFYACIYVGF